MAAEPSAKKPQLATERSSRLSIARQTVATALVQCLIETGTSQQSAALALGVAKRTVGAWVRRESPILVERVLASPRLAKAFRRSLCTETHAALPYVARAARARTSKRGSK